MKTQDVRMQHFVAQLRCDRCGVEAHHDIDIGFNNFLVVEFDTGWGSVLGDGTHVEIDLCHTCVQKLLGPWLRLSAARWVE